ncbi:putative pectate lyase C [Venturia inaequalis]|nr:putative pectate lyase C [Venturia inaequalis]
MVPGIPRGFLALQVEGFGTVFMNMTAFLASGSTYGLVKHSETQ